MPGLSPETSAIELRQELVDRVLSGVTLLALVGAPVSASRALFSGWLPMYSAHLTLAAILLVCWLFRRQLPYAVKLSLIIAMFWAVGLIGLLTLGLLGAGAWWLVTSALLVHVLYGEKAGYRAIGGVLLVVLVFAVAYINGVLQLSVDANTFITAPAAWATFAVGAVLQPMIIFAAVGTLHRRMSVLNERVIAQAEEIQLLADTDELTSLPRRHVAFDRLDQELLRAKREHHQTGVLFFDLDGFKKINDVHGHTTGDRILQAAASRSRACLRASDTIARHGGDEFVVILPNIQSVDAAVAIAEKLIAAISVPIGSEDMGLRVGASVGVAVAPGHGNCADALIHEADKAMYQAKLAGKNQVRVAGQAVEDDAEMRLVKR